jgi:hypothetical protein
MSLDELEKRAVSIFCSFFAEHALNAAIRIAWPVIWVDRPVAA